MAVIINGSAGVTTNAGGSVNPSTNVEGINYSCRAWVNFNGTGTVAIRASGNVSSITDNGTGDYTINFTTAMVDVNYIGVTTGGDYGSVARSTGGNTNATRLTSSYRVLTLNATQNTLTDCDTVYVSIFR
jgi:hypothetical protein